MQYHCSASLDGKAAGTENQNFSETKELCRESILRSCSRNAQFHAAVKIRVNCFKKSNRNEDEEKCCLI